MTSRSKIALSGAVVLLGATTLWWNTRPGPHPTTEIYRGVYYTAIELPETEESGGLAHLVRVDLTAPGIHLYTTPLDKEAVRRGYQYRVTYTQCVARDRGLAVAVNGTLFTPDVWMPWPRRYARSIHTVVAAGQVNHVHPHSYLLWVDSTMTPHVEYVKPPPPDALEKAMWGVGGDEVVLRDGTVRSGTGREPDRRTMVAIDSERKLLWLAAFEHASYAVAAQLLATEGADDGIMLDGGRSTTLVLGEDAHGTSTGTVIGGWFPVATQAGIVASPIE